MVLLKRRRSSPDLSLSRNGPSNPVSSSVLNGWQDLFFLETLAGFVSFLTTGEAFEATVVRFRIEVGPKWFRLGLEFCQSLLCLARGCHELREDLKLSFVSEFNITAFGVDTGKLSGGAGLNICVIVASILSSSSRLANTQFHFLCSLVNIGSFSMCLWRVGGSFTSS